MAVVAANAVNATNDPNRDAQAAAEASLSTALTNEAAPEGGNESNAGDRSEGNRRRRRGGRGRGEREEGLNTVENHRRQR